jgi:hypothetical protein
LKGAVGATPADFDVKRWRAIVELPPAAMPAAKLESAFDGRKKQPTVMVDTLQCSRCFQ